jgi:fluoride ion exporter CrcB/FEX
MKKVKKKNAVSQIIRLFKESRDFNLIVGGNMSGVFLTSLATALLYFLKEDITIDFLSIEIFGSIIIGYFAYARAKKLEKNK